MSEHSDIVRSYIELRNYLARSNPQPNMEFDIQFEIDGASLFAFNPLSKAKVELAKIHSIFFRLNKPTYGVKFEAYTSSIIAYINTNLFFAEPQQMKNDIVFLASKHKSNLGLDKGYEPRDK